MNLNIPCNRVLLHLTLKDLQTLKILEFKSNL